MRLLLLFLMGMSMLNNAWGVAPVIDKGQKPYHLYKGKAPNNYNDVWERIRVGIKIAGPNILPKQVHIPEKNNTPPPYPSRAAYPSSLTASDMGDEADLRPEQKVTPKYKIQPHTAVAPANNYTELGLRLRFGDTPPPPSADDNCVATVPVQNQQEHKPQKRSPDNSPNRSVKGGGAENAHLVQVSGNAMPCAKPNAQRWVGLNKHRGPLEGPNSTKNAAINDRINKQLTFFSQNPDYLYRVAERARPYLYHIVEALSQNKLPLDLALLPIVESAYQPRALSPKGAAGLWQFIPGTGKDYDLKQNNQYDERLDVLASTRAAIRFLSDLKEHFNGDWLLALAAYNCGQGAVDSAISRNLSEKLETDYWSLHLPEETQDYVPRLLALSKIFANPDMYGLAFPAIKNEPYFVKVRIDRENDIKYLTNKKIAVLAKLVDMSHEQFVHLNPGYLKPTLPTGRGYTFLLPHANADQLNKLLTSIAQFMAEPVSQSMKAALKPDSPDISDLTAIRL